MIVSSMSFKEMFDCLEADRPKLDYQREKILPKISKEFEAENKIPNYKWVEYKPSSGTEFLILFYADSLSHFYLPLVRYCATVWNENYRYIVTWMYGQYKHPLHDFEQTPMIYAYTKHFINQYSERFLKDTTLSANDTITRFLMRNLVYTPIDINKKINRNIDKKDESYRRGFSVDDGICFTRFGLDGEIHDIDEVKKDKVTALCFVFTTYYNPKNMFPEQLEAIGKEEEKAWDAFYKNAKIKGSCD